MTLAPARSDRPRSTGWRRFAGSLAGTAGALAAVMVLASCSLLPGGQQAKPTPGIATADASIVESAPEDLREFYAQEVSWESCEGGQLCAEIKVPMDYANPSGETITISALRMPATGEKQGTLLVNPGGPGGSGYDFVLDAGATYFSDEMHSRYDILGFDPRGVKRSAPVTCLTDQERDAARAKVFELGTDAGLAAARAENQAFAAKCAEKSGEVLGFVDTTSAAKDMDILRAVSNDSKLHYLGYSYGTFLGSVYASLFPDNVGRMVLDGALDPALSNEEVTYGQATAFEKALRTYVGSCQQGSDCPFKGSVDEAVAQIQALINDINVQPRTASDGRQVNATMFVNGIITPLYSNANWPTLTAAFSEALKGNVGPMLSLSDFGADREGNGTYGSNSALAFTAINCLDYPMVTDTAAMRADEQKLREASPTFGSFLAYGGITCIDWPYKNVRSPAPVEYSGEQPIVVVGTTGDPATPVEWATSLRKQLGNASLVTWEGEGHTAYGRSNSCVTGLVDQYFLHGTVPADNSVC